MIPLGAGLLNVDLAEIFRFLLNLAGIALGVVIIGWGVLTLVSPILLGVDLVLLMVHKDPFIPVSEDLAAAGAIGWAAAGLYLLFVGMDLQTALLVAVGVGCGVQLIGGLLH